MLKMDGKIDRDYLYYDLEDESDPERAEDSSEDELDILLHGTPEQMSKVRRHSLGQKSSSEDEFEKEMNKELNCTVEALEAAREKSLKSGTKPASSHNTDQMEHSGQGSEAKGQSGGESSGEPQKYYDDVYFDSDEEEMVKQGDKRLKRKHPVISNDDLLYDPNMDDQDQQWVDRQLRSHHPAGGNATSKGSKVKALPNSDAVLNCPACMSLLCLDCQSHAKYPDQYRAMFVVNCTTDTSEVLKYPAESPSKNKNKKNKKKKKFQEGEAITDSTDDVDKGDNSVAPCIGDTVLGASNDSTSTEDKYHPVRCTECNTTVAVYDSDEVYHFFNILASH